MMNTNKWLVVVLATAILGLGVAADVLAQPTVGRDGKPFSSILPRAAPDSDCFLANGTPGCDDAACEASVCSIDPFCCDIAWDGICADEALADPVCLEDSGVSTPEPIPAVGLFGILGLGLLAGLLGFGAFRRRNRGD